MYRKDITSRYGIVFKNNKIFQNNSYDKIKLISEERKDNIQFLIQRNVTGGKVYVDKFINIDKIDYVQNMKDRNNGIELSRELKILNSLIK